MTEPDAPETVSGTAPESPDERRKRRTEERRRRLRRRLVWLPFWGGAGLVGLVVLLVIVARFAVLTDAGWEVVRSVAPGHVEAVRAARDASRLATGTAPSPLTTAWSSMFWAA